MKIDIASMKKWSATEKNNGKTETDSLWWTPSQGENEIRFINNPVSDINTIAAMYKHYNVGPNNWSVWCPKSNGQFDPKKGRPSRDWNATCPLCDSAHELYNSTAQEDKAMSNRIKATPRYIFNIVDLKEPEKGVRLFTCAQTLYEIIMNVWDEKHDLSDPEKGYNFMIVRDGSQKEPRYFKSKRADDPSPIQNKEWLDKIIDPYAMIKPTFKSYEDLSRMMKGDMLSKEIPPVEQPIVVPTKIDEIPEFFSIKKEDPLVQNDPIKKEEKKSKKQPPCFGEFDETSELCEKCSWEGLCIENSENKSTEDSSELDDEEKEILASLKK